MKIQCPNCAYTREMADERIPSGVVTARCPQCGQTFRFSRESADSEQETRSSAVRLSPLCKDRDAERPDPDTAPKADAEVSVSQKDAAPDLPQGAVVHEQEENLFARPLARKGDENTENPDIRNVRVDETGTYREEPLKREERKKSETIGASEAPENPEDRVHTEDEEGWSFNPWECARTLQEYVPALYQTCLRVMFAPQRFFAGIVPRSGLLALAFFLAICVLQTLIEHVWSIAFFSYIMPTTTDPELRQLGELISGKGNFLFWLVLRCVMLCLQLYIYTAILFLCWRLLARAQADFSVILQVLCYAQAPLILCIIPGVGTIAGMIWSFVCALVGCKAALRLSWAQTILGAAPLVLLIAFSYMHFMSLL